MDCFKEDGVCCLVVSSAGHMLTSRLSWPLNPYKIMADRKVCAHALVCLLSWLDFPLFGSHHQRGEFGQFLKNH